MRYRVSRWDPCVWHRDEQAEAFVREYFGTGTDSKRTLLVGAAGFNPLSTNVARLFGGLPTDGLEALFIREERPESARELSAAAENNVNTIRAALPAARFNAIEVFSKDDQALVGGRQAVACVAQAGVAEATDIVVDLTAFSVGVGFPIVRYFLQVVRASSKNLHVLLTDAERAPESSERESADEATVVHGFQGALGLHGVSGRTARLWVPQLALGRRQVLQKALRYVREHAELVDVCPLLPFPARVPRAGDALLEHYGDELERSWSADERSIVYADDADPIDAYRTLLRLDTERQGVFEALGGSEVVLSPVGGKATALGCLMAAVERDMPVVYVETLRYGANAAGPVDASGRLVHVWLHGDAYDEEWGSKSA